MVITGYVNGVNWMQKAFVSKNVKPSLSRVLSQRMHFGVQILLHFAHGR